MVCQESLSKRCLHLMRLLAAPVATVAILCLTVPALARDLGTEQLSPRDQEARERYLALRGDFLDLLQEAERRVEASALSLAVTYYRSAEMRAERGFYSAALLDLQRAVSEVQRALGGATDEELIEAAERQLTRLDEILAEAERVARESDTESVRRSISRAYREREEARRAFDEHRYRDAVSLARRGTQLAQEALRLAQRGGAQTEERIRERVQSALRAMDELVVKAVSAPAPEGNADFPQVVAELRDMASRAHDAATAGRFDTAIRFADRVSRLCRLVLRQAGLHELLPPDRLLHELESLVNLLERGRSLAIDRPEPTAVRLLDEAQNAVTAVEEAIHGGDFDLAQQRVREGTEKVIRALGLLGPASTTLETHAREALAQLRRRYIPAAEQVLAEHPGTGDAEAYVDRARVLADQAETQISARQPLAALGSIRIAVELTIQAVRQASAFTSAPASE